MAEKIKVLVVDDSSIVRNLLTEKLSKEADFEVIGSAPDPYVARDMVVKYNPDVITLDIEMPRMDGLTFLEKIMSYHPMPVIIVSSVTTKDSTASIKALELGAFDVVNKPGGSISVAEVIDDIIYKIRAAYSIKDSYLARRKEIEKKLIAIPEKKYDGSILSKISTTDKIIAIGASTGGTVALEFILKNLPETMPPILITQHMPPNFTKQFADRLNDLSRLKIKEAEDDDVIANGHVYIAKGGYHLEVERRGASLYTKLVDSERVHFQKPAVDKMFFSLAKNAGQNVIGVLLTGMGKDGAAGLLELKNAGAYTIAQDEATSVVWGMPREAVERNAAIEVLPLDIIPNKLVELSKK